MKQIEITAEGLEGKSIRLDKYISEYLQLFSRSQIKTRNVKVNMAGKALKLSRKVEDGDVLSISFEEPPVPDLNPENIPLSIIYEDENTIVIDKPQGMVVHPAAGHYSGTMVHGLMYYCRDLTRKFDLDENLPRPGIVHRLDKETSGVIITAKNPETQEYLSSQFRDKTTEKKYLAVVKGRIENREGTIINYLYRDPRNRKKYTWGDDASRGKRAVTHYRVLKKFGDYTFVRLKLETGRTHQIRVHMLSLGHPIVGDEIYGRKDKLFSGAKMMLHAYRLKIRLPSADGVSEFRAPLPERFKEILLQLGKGG